MSQKILIATTNHHKIEKIKQMFDGNDTLFEFYDLDDVKKIDVEETEDSFEKNAILKAREHSKHFKGLVITTDGGVVIPSLPTWDPLYTRRFAGDHASDHDRIAKMLDMMRDKKDAERRMYWQEAIALCKNGKRLFSMTVQGIDGVMGRRYDPAKYKSGIWLCSIWEFPQFDGKNFFDLSEAEQKEAEISWTRLGNALYEYLVEHKLIKVANE